MCGCEDSALRPWDRGFDDGAGGPPRIVLEQLTTSQFALRSTLRFLGPTATPGPMTVTPADLPCTDLASVPPALQWFVGPYGPHTPAALLHDRLIGDEAPTGYDRVDADQRWLDALRAVGVPPVRRWMMWSAVAAGTQWSLGGRLKLRMAVWAVASLIGMTVAGYALVTWSPVLLVAALAAPIPFAALWGRQWKAGLVASVTAPWVLPPTAIGLVGHGVYWCLESLVLWVAGDREPADRPIAVDEY
jgi:hypothetical protein